MWIAVFVVLVAAVNGRSDIPEEDILDDLFYSYNKHARPSIGPDHTVTVTHSLTLTRIVSMDKNVLTADTWQMMKWRDSRLIWDPDDYSQVSYINIPDDLIWTPDIILYNNAAATSGKTYASIRVVVNETGDAVWIPGTRVTAYCEVVTTSTRANISAGDFKCPLKFGSWTYHEKSLNMTIDEEGLMMGDYIDTSDYEIIDNEVTRENLYYQCCPDPYTSITYTLWLRRKCETAAVHVPVCGTTDTSDDDGYGDENTDSTGDNDSDGDDTDANTGDDDHNNDNSDTSDDDGDDDSDTSDLNNNTVDNDGDDNVTDNNTDINSNTTTSDDDADDDNTDSSDDTTDDSDDTNEDNLHGNNGDNSDNNDVQPVVTS